MKYYSPDDIAEMFNLHPATVRKWIRDKKLKAIKLSSVWRVSEDDLQEFMKKEIKE